MHPWMTRIFGAYISIFVVDLCVLWFKYTLFNSVKFICIISCYNYTVTSMRIECNLEVVLRLKVTFLCKWSWNSSYSYINSRNNSLLF
jgi:hypothetical protein